MGVWGQLIKWKSQAFEACCARPVEQPLSQGFKRTPPSVPVCHDASGPCKSGPVPGCLTQAPCRSSQGELEDAFSTRTCRKRPWRAAGSGARLLPSFVPCPASSVSTGEDRCGNQGWDGQQEVLNRGTLPAGVSPRGVLRAGGGSQALVSRNEEMHAWALPGEKQSRNGNRAVSSGPAEGPAWLCLGSAGGS